ncbi:MAG: phosphotransferase, partial [Candidatus Hodarchaeota archaeon]
NEKSAIIVIIKKIRSDNTLEIKPLASALNEVFLLVIDNEKLVVKKFTNWYNFKWFILNIAAYGTKIFSLSGKARLANEYGINRLLTEKNIHVPEIVAISLKDRVLVEKYVDGESTLDFISKIFSLKELTNEQKQVAFDIGRTLALIHSLDIVIGDCKPENFIIGSNGHIHVLDLEQGERKGDKTWDVAEFLYFSGHFGSTFTGGMRDFVNNFIKGYGQLGDEKVLKRAASFRYFRVFFGWTLMPIIKSIASLLKSR